MRNCSACRSVIQKFLIAEKVDVDLLDQVRPELWGPGNLQPRRPYP
jgi:hypothetical protein